MSEKKIVIPQHQEVRSVDMPRRRSISQIVSSVRPGLIAQIQLSKAPIILSPMGQLSAADRKRLFKVLENRLGGMPIYKRPEGVKFEDVRKILERAGNGFQFSLNEMERTGGQPDILSIDGDNIIFADFSPESPMGRRGQKYVIAEKLAKSMGAKIMPKGKYFEMQTKGMFDVNTLSWISTPAGARRGGKAFIAHYNEASGEVIFDITDDNAGKMGGYVGWRAILEVPII